MSLSGHNVAMVPHNRNPLIVPFVLLSVFVGVLAIPSTALTAHPRSKRVTLTVKDAPIRAVFVFLGKEAGINIVMSEAVKGSVSVSLNKVRVWTAMRVVAKLKQFELMRIENVLLVMSREEYLRELQRRRRR